MKATINRKELADALRAVSKFLPRMTAIPALSHLLVEAHSGIVAITATDHEAGRRVEVEADVGAEGDILAPAALAQIVGSGADDEVTLSATDEILTVKIGRASNRLRLGNREDYPNAEPDDGDMEPLAIESWYRVQAMTAAISGDSGRPILTGVKLEGGQAIATDSHRLTYCTFADGEHPEALVPARAIKSLDAEVSALQIGDRQVKATVESGAWWARLIEGAFPKWRSLVEDQPDSVVKVSFTTEQLAGVVARAAHVTDRKKIPLRLTIGDGEVKAWASQQDLGEFEETFEAITKWEGQPEDLTVAYDPAYLSAMADPVAELTLGVIDGMKPTSVEGDDWFHGMLMPVRI